MHTRSISQQRVVIIIYGRSMDYLEIRVMELVRIIKLAHRIRANSISNLRLFFPPTHFVPIRNYFVEERAIERDREDRIP